MRRIVLPNASGRTVIKAVRKSIFWKETDMASTLEDKDKIHDLLSSFCDNMDLQRFDEFAALFTEDGVFYADDVGQPKGRAAIRAFAEGILPVEGEGPKRKHIMTNVFVNVDGDTARSNSTFIMVRESASEIVIAAAGRYEDELARDNGVWRFKTRRLIIDFRMDLGLKAYQAG
jgi:ketosteroid isomerase-like protein